MRARVFFEQGGLHSEAQQAGEETIEALQVLKYSTKQQRILYVGHGIARDQEYTLEGPLTEYAIQELIASNSTEELRDLLTDTAAPL